MFFTVNSCCCGCSLRTGTLIVLYLYSFSASFLFGLTLFSRGPLFILMISGIVVICSWTALYGVNTKNPGLLQPFLCVMLISIIVSGVFLVIDFQTINSDTEKKDASKSQRTNITDKDKDNFRFKNMSNSANRSQVPFQYKDSNSNKKNEVPSQNKDLKPEDKYELDPTTQLKIMWACNLFSELLSIYFWIVVYSYWEKLNQEVRSTPEY